MLEGSADAVPLGQVKMTTSHQTQQHVAAQGALEGHPPLAPGQGWVVATSLGVVEKCWDCAEERMDF